MTVAERSPRRWHWEPSSRSRPPPPASQGLPRLGPLSRVQAGDTGLPLPPRLGVPGHSHGPFQDRAGSRSPAVRCCPVQKPPENPAGPTAAEWELCTSAAALWPPDTFSPGQQGAPSEPSGAVLRAAPLAVPSACPAGSPDLVAPRGWGTRHPLPLPPVQPMRTQPGESGPGEKTAHPRETVSASPRPGGGLCAQGLGPAGWVGPALGTTADPSQPGRQTWVPRAQGRQLGTPAGPACQAVLPHSALQWTGHCSDLGSGALEGPDKGFWPFSDSQDQALSSLG